MGDNSQDDYLKQLFVYNMLWDASQPLLLYPRNCKTCKGSYLYFILSDYRKKEEIEKYLISITVFYKYNE